MVVGVDETYSGIPLMVVFGRGGILEVGKRYRVYASRTGATQIRVPHGNLIPRKRLAQSGDRIEPVGVVNGRRNLNAAVRISSVQARKIPGPKTRRWHIPRVD